MRISDPSVESGSNYSALGLRLIHGRNQSFTQGSESAMSAPDERPAMTVAFSYDFWMDSTEVTQAAYQKLMGRNPVPNGSRFGKGDRHPVYDVTWYDAVRFCNARSREAGLDTVYEYSGMTLSPDGKTYGLQNLITHFEKMGFRLPTESEWEYAAKGGSGREYAWGDLQDSASAFNYAWFLNNSGDSAHPVATLSPNAYGLYDMAGNLMEWVNDWKGSYSTYGNLDFAGARNAGPLSDIPIKGGSFKDGWVKIRPANRSATYPTVPSSFAEYVGFRCVLGGIANPNFISEDGKPVKSNPVSLLPTDLEGRAAKLVFVNANGETRYLDYVNYASFPPRVQEFAEINSVFNPTMSPNGQWVAFGTSREGADTGSYIYVRKLDSIGGSFIKVAAGFIPRWWVDQVSQDTFLVYTNSAVDNLDARWPSTKTLMQKIQGGKAIGSPVVLATDGGFHDGRSRDGRIMATGYRRLRIMNLASHSSRILFTGPDNGKEAGDTSQVCNVSVSPDSTDRILFLDFGYPKSSALIGSRYNVHEYAFISDTSNHINHWYRAPLGEAGWEDLEWSNQSDFAVSGAIESSDSRNNLYLLGLKDSTYSKLATGTNLLEPGLWIGSVPTGLPPIDIDLDLDSLGHYNDPLLNPTQSLFSDKMNKFWRERESFGVVATGSSHVQWGFNPNMITKWKAFNLGITGTLSSRILATEYVLRHCPNLKVLIYEVFIGVMVSQPEEGAWNNFLASSKGVLYDQSHNYWSSGFPINFTAAMNQAPHWTMQDVDSLGNYPGPTDGGWGPTPPPTALDNTWTVADANYQNNFRILQNVASLAAQKGVHVIFVNFPQNPAYKNTMYYQRVGPSWNTAREVVKQIKSLESVSPLVHFFDAYNFGDHDYTDADAFDADHLSPKGAEKLSGRLDSLINSFPSQ